MNGIKIDERLLLRETTQMIDRDRNTYSINLRIDPYLGATVSKETLEEIGECQLMFTKSEYPEIWRDLKDSVNESRIKYISEQLNRWVTIKDAPPPEVITEIINDPIKGDIKVASGVEETSEAYLEKVRLEESMSLLKPLLSLRKKYTFEVVEI